MVRTADHDARRRQITGAAVQIALDEGIGRVTVAGVAKQAAISVGLVQHYFSSKEALMRRVYEALLTEVDERIAAVVDAGERSGMAIRQMIIDGLAQLLPLDAGRRQQALVLAEFRAIAGRDDELGMLARERERALRARLAGVADNGRRCGETRPEARSEELAADLWAAVSGASEAMVIDPEYPAKEIVAAAAERAFPLPCQRAKG